eukprot:SAG11_NODE_12_length_27025_cov_37.402681_4_plen_194_part_00
MHERLEAEEAQRETALAKEQADVARKDAQRERDEAEEAHRAAAVQAQKVVDLKEEVERHRADADAAKVVAERERAEAMEATALAVREREEAEIARNRALEKASEVGTKLQVIDCSMVVITPCQPSSVWSNMPKFSGRAHVFIYFDKSARHSTGACRCLRQRGGAWRESSTREHRPTRRPLMACSSSQSLAAQA